MTWHDIGCPVQDRISWWDTPSSRTTGFSQNASTERVVPVTDLENHKMMTSWVPGVDPNSDFSLANIPFGIISVEDDPRDQRAAVAIGTYVLDLGAISAHPDFLTIFPCLSEFSDVFTNHILNPFATLGRQVHRECRAAIQDLLSTETRHPEFLRDNAQLRQEALLPQSAVVMHLPMEINDYTDFYAGYHHAHAVGALFRGPGRELQPNYTHLPVAYTGRKSSVVVTGASIRRPRGQILFKGSTAPTVALTRCLDFELELGCFMAKHNQRGTAVKVDDAEDKIFGYVLLNDWSARDIQQWEYVPLGPFNGKNFATTISPWVVLADALEPFRTTPIENKTPLQEYLKQSRKDSVFDIQLEVELTTPEGDTTTLCRTSSKHLMWSFPQMIAHHTLGGCMLESGDLLGSGTISGPNDGERGSLLEMTEAGKNEVHLRGGSTRVFLEDGDIVTIRGSCGEPGQKIGFGKCRGRIYGTPNQ